MAEAVDSSDVDGVHQEIFKYDNWIVTSRKSHILQSKCGSSFICDKQTDNNQKCLFCRYNSILSMPHLPDMTYARNSLRLEHTNAKFVIEFNCNDALILVKKQLPSHLVSAAEEWQKSRSDVDFSKKGVKDPFDWTFTTDYKGTFFNINQQQQIDFVETDEKINIEKLKVKEEILYYDEIHLFEDELSDHGVAKCSVKIRVMKSSFFILLRYFLRIDNVLVRIHDTRYYHEFGTNYMLREYTSKETLLSDVDFPTHVIIDPVEISNRLEPKQIICQKLILN